MSEELRVEEEVVVVAQVVPSSTRLSDRLVVVSCG